MLASLGNNKVKATPHVFNIRETANSISKYQDIFDAILSDDSEYLQAALVKSDFNINAPFDFEDGSCVGQSLKHASIYLPFHLAVCYVSSKVVALFLQNKVNVFSADSSHHNVLHNCVITALRCPIIESKICEMITDLDLKIGNESMWTLLTQENSDGLRPLEFAAQQGTLNVMIKILHLKGYATVQVQKGAYVYQLHDITEYEMGPRHAKSPINLLSYLDKQRLQVPNFNELFHSPLIKGWISGKMKSNVIPLIVWILFRLFIFGMFLLVDNDSTYWYRIHGSNVTNFMCQDLMHYHPGTTPFYVQATLMLSLSISILIFDVLLMIKRHLQGLNFKHKNIHGSKNLVASIWFYQISQSLFLIFLSFGLVLYFYIMMIDKQPSANLFTLISIPRIIIPLLMLWSACYFGQLIPKIGVKIISLQKMVIDLVTFMIVLVLANVFFIHTFQSFVSANSLSGCVEEFSNPWNTMYTLFRMMLNMYDTTSINIQNEALFQTLHIVYILLVGIMAINFLIAIMSSSATNISENGNAVVIISQLAIVSALEDKIYWFTKWFYAKVRRHGFHVADGKCYIVSVHDRYREYFIKKFSS